MNIHNILNDGGATLDGNLNPVYMDHGYFVSRKGGAFTYRTSYFDILNIILEMRPQLRPFEFLGFWVEGNRLYIDFTSHFPDYDSAVKFALDNDQRALFDCTNKKSIYLDSRSYL